ncbi:MAG: class B sortase [Candidatus Pelethousia sp.]|nr:class B sortase [Candidatus Pelethousia sp.]
MKKNIIAILLALVAVLAVGCSGGEAEQVVIDMPEPSQAPATTAPVAVEPTPTPAPAYVSPYTDKVEALKAKNSDCIGWIAIPGTNIDKAIMYGDNWYYANHNEEKKEIESGAIYSHYNSLTQNVVITGHNSRTSKTMFHELHHVQEVNLGKTNCAYSKCNAVLDKATLPDFSTAAGRTWDISVFGVDAQWEVFSMYEVDAKEPEKTLYYNTWYPAGKNAFTPKDSAEIQEWVDYQIGRSQFDFGVTATPNDQFLTIYTCGDNHDSSTAQSRLYFFLKQVNPVSTLYGGGAAGAAATAPEATIPAE